MGDVVYLWAAHRSQLMTAGELMYFYGAPLAHVVAYEEHWRLLRLKGLADAAMRNDRRRFGGRALTFR